MASKTIGLAQDLRYAVRMLRRSPGVTTVAVLSLALGIGANTAIFTLIESALLRPIALKHPDRIRLLTWREQWGGWVPPNLGYLSSTFGTIYEQRETADGGLMHTDFAPAIYHSILRRNTVFDSLFTFKELGRVTVVIDGNAEPVNCFAVSGDFYHGLEVGPVLGRAIAPENDSRAEDGHVALISYEYWIRRYGRDPRVIGKTITLNEVPVTIIGVNPEYFTGIEPGAHFEVWAPLSLSSSIIGRSFLEESNAWQIPMMGRLRNGVSDAQAQAELESLFEAGIAANPGPLANLLQDPAKRPRFILRPAARGVDYLTPRYDRMLFALFALAGLVLLIACGNVANLLLAKCAARQREIGLRLALGAGRGRIARQLLTEGLLLAALAGISGIILGYWTRNALPALLSAPWRRSPFDPRFDLRALLVSLGIVILTGVLFSLAPMRQSGKVELSEALKEAGQGFSRLRLGRLLVAAQIALSALLLVAAGMFVKTFTNLKGVPLGFRPDGVLMFTLDPPRLLYSAERTVALATELQERIDALPGVESAAFSRNLNSTSDTLVGDRFFETMGIPILSGRALERRDRAGGPLVAVVNRAFARRYFPGENAIGMSFKGADGASYIIAGICADWHIDRLRDPVTPAAYRSLLQAPEGRTAGGSQDPPSVHRPSIPITFEVRMSGNKEAAMRGIREVVRSVDSNLAITDVRTAMQQIEDGWSQERLMASLAVVFGALALILAAIGIYGAMAYAVARRTSEIGIRMALGARPGAIAAMVLRETVTLAAAGLAVGVGAVPAVNPALDRWLAPGWQDRFLYGLKPHDPAIVAAAGLTLALAAVLAGYLPARRAARLDPTAALRHE